MLAANTGLTAQEITITLNPGYNWISYPNAVAMGLDEALGGFVPSNGDIIMSRSGNSGYYNGRWRGGVTQFIPGLGYMYYSARSETVSFVFAKISNVEVTTATPTDITSVSAVIGGTITVGEGNHIFARGICWGTEPNPDIDGNHIAGDAVAGSQSVTLDGLTSGATYYVRAYVVTDNGLAYGEEQNFTTASDHAYVDLGLPSGLLWATCNVGADTPEGYGDYFAWGETTPKSTYSFSNYLYYNGDSLTKYTGSDGLTTLLYEDDVAAVNWGEGWRMPTNEEFRELLDNTTITWTTQNGVNGRLFSATNGNSLFLPAVGCRVDGDFIGADNGYYWSSSLTVDVPFNAKQFYFYSGVYEMNIAARSTGQSVRPVRSGQSSVPTGAINGKFTINEDGGQVYYSQGNLQYQASTDTWRFAENQYDYVGDDNSNISSSNSGWIDLFGWGTSGYNHGASCYQPWSTSTTNSDYYAYGNNQYNLYDQTGQADWGYNPISNGGNAANQWRTLTLTEWNFLFYMRATTSGVRYAKANVNNVNGVILLPDDWNTSTYSLSSTNSSSASFSSNTLTASQWSILEQAGAVFLPATGGRYRTSITDVGSYGYYWSASCYNSYNAYYVNFYGSGLSTGYYSGSRCGGQSVRLVQDVE